MSGIVEKISDRYAEEIGSLPSIGVLTSFIILLCAASIISKEDLHWVPTMSQLLSKSIADIFDKDDGIIAESSLGAVILSASISVSMKFLYRYFVKVTFNKISRFPPLTNYIEEATKISTEASLSKERASGEGEAFITNELSVQRKIFQRIHDYSFVLFLILILSITNINYLENISITVGCLILLTCSEIFLLKVYLTRLFPAICIASAYTQKVARFGDT